MKNIIMTRSTSPRIAGSVYGDRESGQEKDIYKRPVLRTKLVRLPRGAITGYTKPYCPDIYWNVSPNGRILIGFSDKYELELYDPAKGKIGFISKSWNPVKVSHDERKRILEFSRFIDSKGNVFSASDDILKADIFPDYKPAFDEVYFDQEDNILVHPITAGGSSFIYDAFSPDGKFISRVEFSGTDQGFKGITKQASDGSFFSFDMDPDGIWLITKWRIAE